MDDNSTIDYRRLVLFVMLLALVLVLVVAGLRVQDDRTGSAEDQAIASEAPAVAVAATSTPKPTPTPTPTPYPGWVDPASFGEPYGEIVEGLLTFRGNPTRSFYGRGAPQSPTVAWSFPPATEDPLCSTSTTGPMGTVATTTWCGTGWTGQASIFVRNARTWVVFGSFGSAVHFVDGVSGQRILPDFPVGDIIKGSVTVDPDGFPIVYFGSRDNKLRAVSFDGPEPEELWSIDAEDFAPILHDNDWDGSPLVIDDYLFEGGENSRWFAVKLNRGYDQVTNRVTVDPEVVVNMAAWTDELLEAVGDDNVSIENSVAISGDTIYFANSGGLIQGWDISDLQIGTQPTKNFEFWAGDDIDASLVIDEEGMIYAGVEWERSNERSREVGQIIKLDPSRPDDPLVWSLAARVRLPDGVWATPAVTDTMVYVPTNEGFIKGIDRTTGELVWEKKLQGPVWSSPAVVDELLILPDCVGTIHAWDVSDPTIDPPEVWTANTTWCTESTVAIWDGLMVVGDRKGRVWAFTD